MIPGFYPSEPSTGRRRKLVAELTAPHEFHVHFATFENSIFVQKRTLVKLLGPILSSTIERCPLHVEKGLNGEGDFLGPFFLKKRSLFFIK